MAVILFCSVFYSSHNQWCVIAWPRKMEYWHSPYWLIILLNFATDRNFPIDATHENISLIFVSFRIIKHLARWKSTPNVYLERIFMYPIYRIYLQKGMYAYLALVCFISLHFVYLLLLLTTDVRKELTCLKNYKCSINFKTSSEIIVCISPGRSLACYNSPFAFIVIICFLKFDFNTHKKFILIILMPEFGYGIDATRI